MQRAINILSAIGSLLVFVDLLRAENQTHSPDVTPAPTVDTELRRRGLFGAQLDAVSREVRERQRLDTDGGVVLRKIVPDTSAANAEFEVGDVILGVGGVKVTGVAGFNEKVTQARAGDVLAMDVVRDGMKFEKRVMLKEMPREKDDRYEVIYSHVTSHGARLRTIVTRPKNGGPHPAVLFLQGYGNFSIDHPVAPPGGFTRIARDLARHGYVTMRVDRQGCGDSEGGPCRDMDFETELDGYRQALKALREFEFVDPGNIFIYGQSMGGFTGPILATEMPVRGIASYGTITGTWLEGILAQRRRGASLDGTAPAEVENRIQCETRFWYPLLVDKQTPGEIMKRYPEYREGFEHLVVDENYVFGRPYSWLHQVVDRNMGEVWTKVASTPLEIDGEEPVYPRVLSIWGTSDWVSEQKPIAWIAEIVNRAQPGNGTFIALDSIDHYYFHAASRAESFRYFKPAKGGPYGKFNPVILATVRSWLDATSGIAARVDPD